jgi:hypothetical protein
VTRRRIGLLALGSVAAAVVVARLDRESSSFSGMFSEAGDVAGLVLWAAGFFATALLVIASATPTHRS